jgi:hypothetical protein
MLTILNSVNNDYYKWQTELFSFNQIKTYGENAKNNCLIVLPKRNDPKEKKLDTFPWNINNKNILVNAYFDLKNIEIKHDPNLNPINIQTGLLQIIDDLDNEETIEILDCDMFHFKKSCLVEAKENEIIACDVYENWHLKSMSDNINVISKYTNFKKDYYNGGFLPLIAKVKTFKKFIMDWICIHHDISKNEKSDLIRWWGNMFAIQAACEINKIKMISKDIVYIPMANTISDSHYVCHYSVDNKFNKHDFPNINTLCFEKNIFYERISSWLQYRNHQHLEPS